MHSGNIIVAASSRFIIHIALQTGLESLVTPFLQFLIFLDFLM
jgi:hypothetical protein